MKKKNIKTSELQYLNLLKSTFKKIKKGELKLKKDRTGVGTYSEVGGQMIFDLSEGFPLLTTKKVFMKGIIHELLWFMRGDTNIRYLEENGVRIWREWPYKKYVEEMKNKGIEPLSIEDFAKKIVNNKSFAKKYGELGPVYGKQWRDFNGVDQLKNSIETIKNNPNSRRIIVNSWNASEIDNMALPPCHTMFQFIVNDGKLSLHLYQRSADMFLGVPFNIASYALLVHIVAKLTGLEVGEFVHSFGDRHIYSNHLDQVKEQLKRRKKLYELPKLRIVDRGQKEIEDFVYEDILLENYESHGTIKAQVAV